MNMNLVSKNMNIKRTIHKEYQQYFLNMSHAPDKGNKQG